MAGALWVVYAVIMWLQMDCGNANDECINCLGTVSFQQAMCNADWAMSVYVKKSTRSDDVMKYRVKIKEVFLPKVVPRYLNREFTTLTSPLPIVDCGLPLKQGREYVVSGIRTADKQLYMSVCDSVNFMPTDDLPLDHSSILDNFRTNYMENCACKVVVVDGSDTADRESHKTDDNCVETADRIECTNYHTYCKKTVKRGGKSVCNWAPVDKSEISTVCADKNWRAGLM